MQHSIDPTFEAVEHYAVDRGRRSGDVYGWAPLERGKHPRALLVVAEDAPPESFPSDIAGVAVALRAVPMPEPQRR